jgi:hypothetical protein
MHYGSGSAEAKRCGSGSGSITLVVKWPHDDLFFCVQAGEEDALAEVASPVEETGKHNISSMVENKAIASQFLA